MVWHLTYIGYHIIQPLANLGCSKTLVMELFTFIPKRLRNWQNLHVECSQSIFKEFVLRDLKFLQGSRGSWVAQLVKSLTLDFGFGHDPEIEPEWGSSFSKEPA